MYLTLLLLLLLPLPVQQADPEEAYRQDYQKYTEISQMSDPAAQAEAYLAFLEKGFDERLMSAVLQGLQGGLVALTQSQNYDKVYELADKWTAQRGDPQPLALAFDAAARSGNHRQITNYGEKFYVVQPVPEVALLLAQSYAELGNEAKVREFGGIAIEKLPIEQTWNVAYSIVGQHDKAGRHNDAAAMANRIRSGLSSAPQGVSAQQWREIQLYLQDTVARAHFEGGRWSDAITGFNAVLRMNSRSDKAYYYIGESLLKTQRIADAMNAFAKSYVLQGGYSARAYDMLETIYKANTGGQTAGMDDVIEQARRQLRNQ